MSAVTSFGHGREQQIEKLFNQLTAELAEYKKTAEHPRSTAAVSDYAAGHAQVCSDILSKLADLGLSSPTTGNGILVTNAVGASIPDFISGPLSPEALYELKLNLLRKFVHYLHSRGLCITGAGTHGDIDFTELYDTFLKGEIK